MDNYSSYFHSSIFCHCAKTLCTAFERISTPRGYRYRFSFSLKYERKFIKFYANLLFSIASSPIYSHISASLQGLTTIRAYKMEDRFMQQFIAYQNNHTKPAFALAGLLRWIAFRLDLLSSIYIVFVAFIGVFVRDGKF